MLGRLRGRWSESFASPTTRRPPYRRRPLFEALEPRLLLSADLLPLSGNYSADPAQPAAILVPTAPVEYGVAQGGFLRLIAPEPGAEPDVFTVEATAGQSLGISVVVLSSADTPSLTLLDPVGSVLANATARDDGTLLIEPVEAATTGTFIFSISGALQYQGAVTLGAQLEDETNRPNDSAFDAVPLVLRPVLPGSSAERGGLIGHAAFGESDWYALSLAAGEEVSLVLNGMSPELEPPLLELWSGSDAQELLARGTDSGPEDRYFDQEGALRSRVISSFVAPAAGEYRIRVSGGQDNLYQLVTTRATRMDAGGISPIDRDLTPADSAGSVRIIGGGYSYPFGAHSERFVSGTDIPVPRTIADGDLDEWDIGAAGEVISGGVPGSPTDPYAAAFRLSIAADPAGSSGAATEAFPALHSAVESADGRELWFTGAAVQGIDVSRRVFVPLDGSFVRYLETVRNDTAVEQLVTVQLETSYALGTRLVASLGNEGVDDEGNALPPVFDTDSVVVVFDDADVAGGTPQTFQILPRGQVLPVQASFDESSSVARFSYQLRLAPGQTRSILHFAGQISSGSDVGAETVLPDGPFGEAAEHALANLSPLDRKRTANLPAAGLPVDAYSVRANSGNLLSIDLRSLPPLSGSASGQLGVVLLDPNGDVIGSNFGFDHGAGIEVALDALAAQTGEYLLRVYNERFDLIQAEAQPWILTVSGSSAGRAALEVVGNSLDPLRPLSADVYITFSAPLLATSLDPGDLAIDGVLADAVELVSATTARFSFFDLSVFGDPSNYAGIIEAGALADIAGSGNLGYRFGPGVRDGLQITNATLVDGRVFGFGSVVQPDDVLTLTFSEDMDSAVLGDDDLVIVDQFTGLEVSGGGLAVDPNNPHTVLVSFSGLSEGTYGLRLRSAADAFRTVDGRLLDGEFFGDYPTGNNVAGGDYQVSFNLDIADSRAIEGFELVRPLGAGAVRSTAHGHLATSGDVDAFTLDLEAGSLLSLRMSGPFGFTPPARVALFSADGTQPLAFAESTIGEVLSLAGVTLAQGDTYRIEVTSLGGIGGFDLEALVDGLLDVEPAASNGGNDSADSAADLTPGWQALGAGLARVTVAGALPADDEDWYRFDAAPGARYAFALAASPDTTLELYDTAGVLVASGWAGGENVSRVITPFASSTGARYLVRVGGPGSGSYGLTVTRGAALEVGATADGTLDPFGAMLGRIGGLPDGQLVPVARTQTTAPVSMLDGRSFGWTVGAGGAPGAFSWLGLNALSLSESSSFGTLPLNPGPLFLQDAGREVALAPRTYFTGAGGTFTFERETWVSPTEGFARFLDTLSNTGSVPVSVTLEYFTNPRTQVSNNPARIVADAGQNGLFDGDAWIVRDDTNATAGTVATGTVFAGTGATAGAVAPLTSFANDFSHAHRYILTLQPGETRSILQFAVQDGVRSSAITRAQQLAALELSALAGLSDDQRLTVANFALPADTDAYRFNARAGDVVTLSTATPGDALGLPDNLLDPFIEVYAPGGTLVAANGNGVPDGRNATLTFTAAATGEYRAVVGGAGQGDYLLRVTGSSAAAATSVTAVLRGTEGAAPPLVEGSLLNVFPATVQVDFSAPLDRSSVSVEDFRLNGAAVAGVAFLDQDSVALTLANAGDGAYTLELPAGAVLDLQGGSAAGFSRSFRTDTTPPRVQFTSLAPDTVLAPGDGVIEIRFSEPIVDPGFAARLGFALGAQVTDGVASTAGSYDATNNTLRVQYFGITEGAYELRVRSSGSSGFVADLAGNRLDGSPSSPLPSGDGQVSASDDFVLPFRVDGDGARVLAPVAELPSGGLLASASARGILHGVGDVDEFTLDLAAGASLSVRLEAAGASRVSVRAPDGSLIASADNPESGGVHETLLQDLAVQSAGTYRVQVEGLGAPTRFEVGALLNGVWEAEWVTGARNDTPAAAQTLAWSELAPNVLHAAVGGGWGERTRDFDESPTETFPQVEPDLYRISLAAGDRLSVALAQADASQPAGFTLIDPTGAVAAVGVPGRGNAPLSLDAFRASAGGDWLLRVDMPQAGGRYHLLLLRNAQISLESRDGEPAQDLSPTGVALGTLSGGLETGIPVPFEPQVVDGEGRLWVFDARGVQGEAFAGPSLTILDTPLTSPALTVENEGRELAAAGTLQGIATVRKSFVPADGSFLRSLELFTNTTSQAKTFTVRLQSAAQAFSSADVKASSTGTAYVFPALGSILEMPGERWVVIDARQASSPTTPGAVVFSGPDAPVASRTSLFSGFFSPGVVYAAVQEVTLTLAPGETRAVLSFIAQGADAAQAAQRAERLSRLESGALEGLTQAERAAIVNFSVAETRDADLYRIRVQAGDVLDITTATPLLDGAHYPFNTLDPRLELLDANGILVAIDEDSAADGRNARLRYTIPLGAGGEYLVRVTSDAGTPYANGEYVLRVTGATGAGTDPLQVLRSTPGVDAALGAQPAAVELTLSAGVAPGSVQASDLQLSGGATATGVSLVDGRTLRFTISGPATAGSYDYSLPAGAVVSLDGQGNDAFAGSYRIDRTGPRVVATTPDTQAGIPFFQMAFHFDELLDEFASTPDAVLTNPSGQHIFSNGSEVRGNTLTVRFPVQVALGQYSVTIGPRIRDLAGNSMDQNADGVNGASNDTFTTSFEGVNVDLLVTQIQAPSTFEWGQPFDLRWTVRNAGPMPALNNWLDKVYLSEDATFDAADQMIAARLRPTTLAVGATYDSEITLNLPIGLKSFARGYTLFVVADADNTQQEVNEANNRLARAVTGTLPPFPDLVVAQIDAPAEVVSGASVQIGWTVTNLGTVAATGTWVDKVYLSEDDRRNADDVLFGTFSFSGTLLPGQSIERTQSITVPLGYSGNRWVIVDTDPDAPGSILEQPNELNNTTVSAPMLVRRAPIPNLQVTQVSAPIEGFSGQHTEISWTVTNSGNGDTNTRQWSDVVFLSVDPILDRSDVVYRLGTFDNAAALRSGESYVNRKTVTLPAGIEGTFHLVVVTDYANTVAELEGEIDNGAFAPFSLLLTPPPDLHVTEVVAPTAPFSGQTVPVTWTVVNDGDGGTEVSKWVDRVYLSVDELLDASDVLLRVGDHRGTQDVVHNGALLPDHSYTITQQMRLPVGLSGEFRFLVFSDASSQVFERTREDNNFLASDPVTIRLTPPPDLEVLDMVVPPVARAGERFQVRFNVVNNGATATPPESPNWSDYVYLSRDVVIDSSDQVFAVSHLGGLEPDAGYSVTANVQFPDGASGDWYVLVRADGARSVFELDRDNNQAAAPVQVRFAPADLAVTSVAAPDSTLAGRYIDITWTVANLAADPTLSQRWTDVLYLSTDDHLDTRADLRLGGFDHNGGLAGGASYTRSERVLVPFEAAGALKLLVRTDYSSDASGTEYEPATQANNTAVRDITVRQELADLQVVSLTAPAAARVGDTVTIDYEVRNFGIARTSANSWVDRLVLSTDAVWSPDDRHVATRWHSNALLPDEGYSTSVALSIPTDLASGEYYVIAVADAGLTVLEGPFEGNNTRAAGPLTITTVPKPDLTVENIDVPDLAYAGSPIDVSWVQRNLGGEMPSSSGWTDHVYLSLDTVFDRGTDLYVGSATGAPLAGNASRTITIDSRWGGIKEGVSGLFYVFVETDANNNISNEVSESNNLVRSASLVEVRLLPPANLVAGTITIPAEGRPGAEAAITYTVTNSGPEAVRRGSWRDQLFLSIDDVWDPSDIAFAIANQVQRTVEVGASYTVTARGALPGVLPGDYRVILRTDIRNSIPETSEADNVSASVDAVALDVDELALGGSVSGTLTANGFAVYRIEVGAGDAVRLRVDSEAGDNVKNEIVARFGQVPDRGRFDVSSGDSVTPDPSVIIPTTQAGTYYITVFSGAAEASAFSLSAEIVPFSIQEVSAEVIGNAGNATLRIEGARFDLSTAFQLVSPTGVIVAAKRVVLENASVAFVTFDLDEAALGLYDVRAVRLDGAVAQALDAVQVAEGGGDDALLLVPRGFPAILAGATVPFNVDYENRTGNDVSAPLLILESRTGAPFGPSATEMSADRPVHFLGAALEGPAEVLRPGAAHTITALVTVADQQRFRNDIRVRSISADDRTPVDDWDEIERALRPNGVSDADWQAFWSRVQPRIGPNWGDYVRFLQRLSAAVSEPGELPVRDVREMIRRELGAPVPFVPSLFLRGRLLDAVDGTPVAGLAIGAFGTGPTGEAVLLGSAVSEANGTFEFLGVQPGTVVLALDSRYFDLDRNGAADSVPLQLTVSVNNDVTAGDLYVARLAPDDFATRATAPQLATMSDGVAHLVYLQDGLPRYAYNAGVWVDGGMVVERKVFGLTLTGMQDLFGSGQAGLVAAWQEGAGNDAEIWFALARSKAGGGYEWSSAGRLTNDAVSDSDPVVAALGPGQFAVVFVKRDTSVKDDGDLYHRIVTVSQAAPGFPAQAQETAEALEPAAGQSASIKVKKTIGELDLSESIGLKFKASAEIQGSADVIDCDAKVEVKGGLAMSVTGDSLSVKIAGSASLAGKYKAVYPNWNFVKAQGAAGFNGDVDWRHGLARILGKLNPPAEFAYLQFVGAAEKLGLVIEDGVVFGLGIKLKDLEWHTSDPYTYEAFGFPDVIGEAELSGRVGPYAQLSVKDLIDVRVEGTANVTASLLPTIGLKSITGVFSISAVLGGWFSYSRSFIVGGALSAGLELAADSEDVIALVFDPSANLGSTAVYDTGAIEAGPASDILQDSSPVLMQRPDGTLVLLWSKALDPAGNVAGSRLLTSTFDGSTWSAPLEIGGARGFITGATLITDASGRDFAVWASADGSGLGASTTFEEFTATIANTDLYFSVRENGVWSQASTLVSTPGTDGPPSLLIDAEGRPVVAWVERGAAGGDRLLSASYVDGVWSAPVLVAQGSGIGGLEMTLSGGSPCIVWSQDSDAQGLGSALHFSVRSGSGWSPAAPLVPLQPMAAEAGDTSLVPQISISIVPFPPPVDCLCSPQALLELQRIANGLGPGASVDPTTCQLVYAPVSVVPRDPNDIIGPEGFGEQRWIQAGERHDYVIRFENASDTSAPASRVEIVQKLDDDLDPRSFRVDDLGFADTRVELAGDRPFYSGRIDLRNTRGIFVDVSASVDVTSGEVFWVFQTIDPDTNQQPIDPFKGFLQPNDDSGRGEGFVSYSVRAKRAALTGTRVDAEATIVFDNEVPIVTPPIFNTLDAGAPASAVSAEAGSDPSTWTLRWDGRDDEGSAVASFDVFVSIDGGDYAPLLLATPALETSFTGEAGHRYAFYSVARDNSGNLEDAPLTPDATFSVTGSASLAGLVFEDLDGDGTRDPGESDIAGLTVWLDADDDGLLDPGETSTVATAQGFSFTGLGSGSYSVRIATPDGLVSTAPPSGRQVVTLVNGETRAGIDFGVSALGSLAGTKYEDVDGDGMRDAGERSLPGWTIFLDTNENGLLDATERSVVTDADGNYLFTGLLPGRYVVAEVQQAGWTQTSPAPRPDAAGALTTTASGIALFVEGCGCGVSWSAATGTSFDGQGAITTLDLGAQSMANALAVTGTTAARASGAYGRLDGGGVRTVVIDTGIDLDHPFFGPDTDHDGVSDRIVFSWDFADDDADASDRNGHGSHVSSIIASQDAQWGGVAPDSDLIVLKVFADSGAGSFTDLEQALQWVIANAAAYDIGVINMSLGDGGAWQQAASRYGLGDEFAALAAMDIITISAAGNNYHQWNALGLAYPGADPAVIAVGATWTGDFGGPWTFAGGATNYATGLDHIAAFSQRDDDLIDVFAPGARFNGANATGGVHTMQGTSQASAFVSGAAALAQQYAKTTLGRQLTTAEFAALLATTSDIIVDGDDEVDNVVNTGLLLPRLNLARLLDAIDTLPASTPGAGGTSQPGSGSPQPAQIAAPGVHEVVLTSGAAIGSLDFGNRRTNTAPDIVSIADQTVLELQHFALTLTANDPDAGDSITWQLIEAFSGATLNGQGALSWTAPGLVLGAPLTFTVRATDAAGAFDEETFSITVQPNPLQVTELQATDSGFTVRFNRPFDAGKLNLYESASFPHGAADVVVVAGTGTTALNGSLVLDADQQGFRFIKSGAPLANGNYTVTLASRSSGFTDPYGRLLDGDGDGTSGDDAVRTFSVTAAAGAAVLALPDFMRGPGQVLAQPQAAGALPIRITSATPFSTVAFEVAYDPLTLAIASVTTGAGGSVAADLSVPGLARITVTFAAPMSAAAGMELVRLTGSIPAGASYGVARVLNIRNVLLDGALPGRGDEALQVVGYAGDATGDAAYGSADLQRLQRVVAKQDKGFGEWALVDPAIIGDVSGNGVFDSADATLFFREISGIDRPEIPPIPSPGSLAASAATAAGVPAPQSASEANTEGVLLAALGTPAPALNRAEGQQAPRVGAPNDAGSASTSGADKQPASVEKASQTQAGSVQPPAESVVRTAFAGAPAGEPSQSSTTPAASNAGALAFALLQAQEAPGAASKTAVFDWQPRTPLLAPLQLPAASTSGWLSDFLNELGRSEKERRPNDRLRIPSVRR